MENSDDNISNGSSDEQEQPTQSQPTNSAALPLLDILDLMQKEKFQPTIPDAVTERLELKAGCVTSDPKMTKLISLAAQTFMAVIAKDTLQHYKMRGAPHSNKFKSKDGKDEPHNILLMEDLVSSVEERGVIVKKPPYLV